MLRQDDHKISNAPIGADQEYSQFESPELEKQIAMACTNTTNLVRDGADKDDLRQAFARLGKLKSRRNPVDIYQLECLMNLGDFR